MSLPGEAACTLPTTQLTPPCRARLAYLAVKLLWRQRLKLVCPALRSYHLKTLLLHYLESADSAALDTAGVQTIFHSLLLFIQQRLEEGCVPHYFISSLNLLQQPTVELARQTKKELEICLVVLRDFQLRGVEDVFSDSTKNSLLLQEFKKSHPNLNLLVILLLLLLNVFALSVGAAIYLGVLSGVLAAIISILYASIVTLPLILVIMLAYIKLSTVSLWCLRRSPPTESDQELAQL